MSHQLKTDPCFCARLINFVLEVEGHMPCIGELQLHLRSIQERKVRDMLSSCCGWVHVQDG